METDIDIEVNEDGGLFYVYILGKRIGRGASTRAIADALARWVRSGIQEWCDINPIILDKAFGENKEKS